MAEAGLVGQGVSDVSKARVEKAVDMIEGYLGPGTKSKLNEAGDLILESADSTKKVRFDINKTYPHDEPHAHVEEFQKIKNQTRQTYKSGPIYTKGY